MAAPNPPTPAFVPGLLFGLLGDGTGTRIVHTLLRAVAVAQAEEVRRLVAVQGVQHDQRTQFARLRWANSEEALMAYLLRTVSADPTLARLHREGWRVSSLDLKAQRGIARPRVMPVLEAMKAAGLVEEHGTRPLRCQLSVNMLGLIGNTYRIQQATIAAATDRPSATAHTLRVLQHPEYRGILEQLLRSPRELVIKQVAGEAADIAKTRCHVRMLVREGLVIATDPTATPDKIAFSIPGDLRRALRHFFPESLHQRERLLHVIGALAVAQRVAAVNALRGGPRCASGQNHRCSRPRTWCPFENAHQ